MTKDEALKMAIEALDESMPLVFGNGIALEIMKTPLLEVERKVNFHKKAIQTCKEALEQPKQFLCMKEIPYKDWVLRFYKMPNGLWYTEGINEEWMNEMVEASKSQPAPESVTTYEEMTLDKWKATHPAPSWQGLSDDEREILYDKAIEMPLANLWNDYAYLIEQALKEKNTC